MGEKIDAGVPTRQALLEAGYTTEQVDEWLTESEDEDLMRPILALKELGAATQRLGTAVGFGVVSVGVGTGVPSSARATPTAPVVSSAMLMTAVTTRRNRVTRPVLCILMTFPRSFDPKTR